MKVTFKKEDITNQWLYDLGKDMSKKLLCNIEIKDNAAIFPEHIASGTFAYHRLSDDIDMGIFNITFKVPVTVERTATDTCKYYAMHINCSPSQVSHFSNGKEVKIGGSASSNISWCASDVSTSFEVAKGETFSGIIIHMTKEFLQKTLWNHSHPSRRCVLRNAETSTCLLAADCGHQCELNNNVDIRRCLIGENHIISRDLYTGMGKLNYELVQEILNFQKSSSLPGKLFMKANILKILALFIERIATKSSRMEKSARFSDANKILEIKQYIDDNAGSESISLTDLAKTAAISKTKLKLKFKEIVGKSAYQYYLDVKMEKAKSILEDSPVQISNLAYELGFKSTSHFSQAFKKHYGVTPKSMAVKN